jgi:uncharacterized membrane protein (DUF373 family)
MSICLAYKVFCFWVLYYSVGVFLSFVFMPLSSSTSRFIAFVEDMLRVMIFLLIVTLLLYAGLDVVRLFMGVGILPVSEMLHDVAFFLVLVKAYNVLLAYLEKGHVSVRYVIEIAIIASFIEVVFAFSARDIWSNVFLGVFGVVTLLIYLVFSQKIPKGKGKR